MADREVYSFKKNAAETVRVKLAEFKRHGLLDLRVFIDDQAGQSIPTRKGLTLSRDLAGELLEALRRAIEVIEGGHGEA
jgi:hypothetical protein